MIDVTISRIRRMTPPGLCIFALLPALLMQSCEEGPGTRVLEHRIENLQGELDELKRVAASSVDADEATRGNLNLRIEQVEKNSAEALEQANTAITQQTTRFQRMEQNVGQVIQMQREAKSMANITPGKPGHHAVQTEHGTFLVRLEGLDKNPVGTGFVARFNIGNPTGLNVTEFILKGEFGQPAPQLRPGEPYSEFSERADAWRKTLTPFEETIGQILLPDSWSQFEMPLKADSEDDLKLIRMTMTVRRAQLLPKDESDVSVISAGISGASLLKTEYGPFLSRFMKMEPEGTGTRVHLMIGNPFGFVLNEAKVSGEFGPAPPQRLATESSDLFRNRLKIWSEQMAPFETTLKGPIKPLQWSESSILLPTTDQSRVNYIRTRIKIVNITLPQAP